MPTLARWDGVLSAIDGLESPLQYSSKLAALCDRCHPSIEAYSTLLLCRRVAIELAIVFVIVFVIQYSSVCDSSVGSDPLANANAHAYAVAIARSWPEQCA